MATFSDLKTRCAERFQDPTNQVYTADIWGKYVNEAYRAVISKYPDWPFLEQQNSTTTITAASNTVTLPGGTFQVHSVFNTTDGYRLQPVSNREAYLETFTPGTHTGLPAIYRVRNATLEVYPQPTATTTLRIEYVGAPADLAAPTDSPAFPPQYHDILIDGALALAHLEDGNPATYETYQQRFEVGIHQMHLGLMLFRTSRNNEIPDTFYSGTLT